MVSAKTKTDAQKWEEIAPHYIKSLKSKEFAYMEELLNKLLFSKIVSLIPNMNKVSILDAGCGEGRFARLLSNLGACVSGCDVSETMIKEATKMESNEKQNINYFVHDLTNSFKKDKKYDYVISNLVLFNIFEFEKAIYNLNKVVKTDGKLIFSILHPCFNITKSQWLGIKSIGKRGGKFSFEIKKSYVLRNTYAKKYTYLFNSGHISYYHRPIETYLSTLAKNGLLVENIMEPILKIQDVPNNENYLHHYLPRFMVFSTRKA